jgi:hypothetical protein
MSYAPEVIADNGGKFCGNALRFATTLKPSSMRWIWLSAEPS